MNPSHLLLAMILLPLLGAVLVGAVSQLGAKETRFAALFVTLTELVLAVLLVQQFPLAAAPAAPTFAAFQGPPIAVSPGISCRFALGLDGMALWLIALTAVLMVCSVLVSWEAIGQRPALFYAMLLLLETGCVGVFSARDLLWFYIFFEFTLIPLFFLIGIWGSEERRYAAVKFFLFTLAGSVLTFLGLLAIVFYAGGRCNLDELGAALAARPLPPAWQWWIFLALFAGFAIKVPLFPLHSWLPLAHVQAPTAGSVILAGVLLKIGAFGFLRFSLLLLPLASVQFLPWMLGLAAAGIVYGGLVALVQTDIKRLIAYSSVSHMGFCLLGMFVLNRPGLAGGTLQLLNHGLATGGLFAIVGMLYERYHTRRIVDLGGLARRLPVLSLFLLGFTFCSIGLPGTNGFAGEFLILLGAFQRAWEERAGAAGGWLMGVAVVSLSGVVLSAWYMLYLVQRVFFGPLKEPHHEQASGSGGEHGDAVRDLSFREIAALAPLLAISLWIGLAPRNVLQSISPGLEPVLQATAAPLAASGYHPPPQAGPSETSAVAELPAEGLVATAESIARAKSEVAEAGVAEAGVAPPRGK